MAYKTISVEVDTDDIDLSDFDNDELIDAIDRDLSKSDIESLQKLLKKCGEVIPVYPPDVETTSEQMKYDFFIKNFNDFTIENMTLISSSTVFEISVLERLKNKFTVGELENFLAQPK